MAKAPGSIPHSDSCITNTLRNKCRKCKNEYYKEYRRRRKSIINNTETATTIPKDVLNVTIPIVHSDNCLSAPCRKKCNSCQNSYARERYKCIKRRKEEAKISLRSDIIKTKKYMEILCLECKKKEFVKKDLCKVCLKEYHRLAKIKSRKKLAACEKENQKVEINKDLRGLSKVGTNIDFRIQTDGNLKSMCEGENEKNDKEKNKSVLKSMLQVKCAERFKDLKEKKKKRKKTIAKKERILSSKTIRNNKSLVKNLLKCETKATAVIFSLIDDFTEENKDKLRIKLNSDQKEVVAKQTVEAIKQSGICSPKSNMSYKVTTALASTFIPKNATAAMKTFSICRNKARQLVKGEQLIRKPNKRRLSEEIILKIEKFYERDDISRVDPSISTFTANGPRRYLNFPVRVVHRLFLEEISNEDLTISYSKFYLMKPDNIKFITDTPLVSCLCVYCQNIYLKLMKLNIPGLKSAYDLYVFLICAKPCDDYDFRDMKCVNNLCDQCKDWGSKIRSLIPANIDLTNIIIWYTWKNMEYFSKNGKKCFRRKLETESGTFDDCVTKLIRDDIFEPGQNFTFVQHYFTQKYQSNMYKQCKDNLKAGECLLLQDFSRNRDIFHQDEIKASYWSKKQVTMHPTVIYCKVEDNQIPKRLVITHLSDITSHDAHIVYYITKDCIEYVCKTLPGIEWQKFYIWSDGCASQYKGKHSFYYLGKFGVDIERNYFGSEHGKGESDLETAIYSKKISIAVKSNSAVINDAYEMCQFLLEGKEEKKGCIFVLIKESDMEKIYQDFEGIYVNTLSGSCTRILHQIKYSQRGDQFLIRPFSCFCENCKSGENSCKNILYNGGNFKTKALQSNVTNTSLNECSDDEECEDNYIAEDDDGDLDEQKEVEEAQIIVQHKELKIEDLTAGDFVIVSMMDEISIQIRRFVSQIREIEDGTEIAVDFLKQNSYSKDVFHVSEAKSDLDKNVCLDDIVMMLPKPLIHRRGQKYFVSGSITL